MNDTITLGYHTYIVVFSHNYCLKKIKSNKRKLLCFGTDYGKFSKKYISISYTDDAGYFYYEVLCFDQDIFKFIPNQISVSKDGIFLSYTYEYE